MNRRMQFINFFGVLALAVLCVFQWQRDRRLNLELTANEKTRQLQDRQLAENANTISGLTDDLARFKADFTTVSAEAKELRDNLNLSEREREQLASECGQLKESITNWVAAVAARDERITEANARLQEMADQITATVTKFNTMATNYNLAVEELNKARASRSEPR